MEAIKTYKSSDSYIMFDDYYLLHKDLNLMLINSKHQLIIQKKLEKEPYSIRNEGVFILFEYDEGKEIVVDLELQEIIELDKSFYVHHYHKDFFIYTKSQSIFEPKFLGRGERISKISFDTIWEINDYKGGKIELVVNNLVLTLDEKNIYTYHIDTGKEIWSFSLEGFPCLMHAHKCEWVEPEIFEIIGIYNSLLWILLVDCSMVAVDINTGVMKHHIDSPLALSNQVNHLDQKNGIIKVLVGNYYREFNLITLKTEEYEFQETLLIHKSTFYEGDRYMYFCARKNTVGFPNSFGIFDTKKKEIVWHEEAKGEEQYFFKPPQANEKLIGILDSNKILHIYNKNDIIL
jgi:hypothetical protein